MGKVTIRFMQDEDSNPRTDWDSLSTMACWHDRYNLGDVQPSETPEEWLADPDNVPEGSIVLPLYLYDHGGITMNTGGFSCRWDSGQVGVIVATPEAIKKAFLVETIDDETRKRAEDALRSEVTVYDHYLQGNTWGYVVEKHVACESCGHSEPEDVDSCWGFFGDSLEDSGMLASIGTPEGLTREAIEAAWEARFDR